ncbi:DNA sulfur modification protein DndB [Paenibacillus naphthalenovorans]|uniref:DNA sulfur modification protein DndB n=1 Tax=Paenibacillus naphthalenovorans TaxID=162209 RepID=A0A0U2W470_9BACL|nr:DNA sulfur modification protein DndB [Paenibacillus naphthalenovorans]ALS22205.1 DNA sulfur modification protein DndB [Paenibacillus naphthalenovorans]
MSETKELNVVEFLTNSFEEISKDRKAMTEIDDLLFTVYKFPIGFFQELVVNPEKLDELEEVELIVLLIAINKVINLEMYSPYNYFSENKVKKSLKYRYSKQEEPLNFPLIYEDITAGSDVDCITYLSYQEIKRHVEQLWTYNFATQRLPVETVKKNGEITKKPKLFKNSVKEIAQLISEGRFKPDAPIVINVMRNGEDEFYIDKDNHRLIIEKATEQNIVDGFHRISGVLAALEKDPDLEGYLYVTFRNYTLEEASEFLGQHNSFNVYDRTHVRFLKALELPDKIVKDIESKSDLRGRIAYKTAVERKKNKITNFAVLSNAIRDTFNPQTGKDRIEVTYVLARFFDYLLGSYPEAFIGTKNVEETWKKSWINHHNTFVLYVTLAYGLYKHFGKDFPLDEITKIVDSIDFTKENGHQFNDLLTDGGTAQGKINSDQTKRKIRQFGEKIIADMYGAIKEENVS